MDMDYTETLDSDVEEKEGLEDYAVEGFTESIREGNLSKAQKRVAVRRKVEEILAAKEYKALYGDPFEFEALELEAELD